MELQDFIAKQIEDRPIEAKIVRKIVRVLKAAGKPVKYVFDGVERVYVSTEKDVLNEAFNLDEVYLHTDDGYVFLTMGEGWDLICDYGLSLDDDLKPVFAWIEKNED